MTKFFIVFLLITALHVSGQPSKQLIGKWKLKNHFTESKDVYNLDSIDRFITFLEKGLYLSEFHYRTHDPKKSWRSIVITGKWKMDSTQKIIHIYNCYEEEPNYLPIHDKDLQIIKITKKKITIYEDLTPYPNGKSIYSRQTK